MTKRQQLLEEMTELKGDGYVFMGSINYKTLNKKTVYLMDFYNIKEKDRKELIYHNLHATENSIRKMWEGIKIVENI